MISLLECIIIQGYYRSAVFFQNRQSQDVGNLLEGCDTKHQLITARKEKVQRSSCALCHPLPPPRDVTQHISTHHEFQGADNFCSDSSVVESHLVERFAYLLYTSICYAGPIKCVSMQKHLRRHTHTHTHTQKKHGESSAAEHRRPCHFGKWSEQGEGWGMCVCVCPLFTCVWTYVGAKVAGDCLLFYKLADSRPPAGPRVAHVGWVAGVSFVAAPCCFCQKQAELSFQTAAEAWGSLLNSHSAPHLNAQWCRFRNETGSYCCPLTRRVESGILDNTAMALRGGVELNFWLAFVECYAAVGPSLFSLSLSLSPLCVWIDR